MATRTIPFAVYKTDGTRYTESTPPTTTVQYGTGAATSITATQRGNAWSVAIDDTQDALVLWSGVGIQPDHIIALRFPTQLDVAVSTRLASASYTTPDNTSIAAIKTKTDNLPASPAATGAAMTLTPAYDAAKVAASQSSVDGLNDISVADIEASTTLAMKADIPTDYSTFDAVTDSVTVGSNNDKTGYTLTSAYDAAKTAAQPSDIPTDYAKDATVMKSNDSNVAAIKAKTDNLPSDPADQSVLAGLIDTRVGALNDLSMLDVAQVLGEYDVATVGDVPTDYATEETATNVLKFHTNRRVVTDSEQVIYDDDDVTPLVTQALTATETSVERSKGV